MNIGYIGLGKLGLPCALSVNAHGHNVYGYDINPIVEIYLQQRTIPYTEIGADKYLKDHTIQWCSLEDVVRQSEIIFVPIQTPHNEKYEGVTRIPDDRIDFDYSHLCEGMLKVSEAVDKLGEDRIVVIISTVLPGTIETRIKPFLSKHVKLAYQPYFIAMGTTIPDFENPEYILFGVDDKEAADRAEQFYATIHDRPVYKTTIKNAEMIKVLYNTMITTKINFVNTIMEMCHKTGADVDSVTDAIKMATDRLISPKYLTAGMGDGGGCHPRDGIALSWLSEKLNLSHNIFEDMMLIRENQTEWLADLTVAESIKHGLSIFILGEAFKPETNLKTGSPATLLKNIIGEKSRGYCFIYDPYVREYSDNTIFKNAYFTEEKNILKNRAVYFIATKHEIFKEYVFPAGSVVIDPWRYLNIETAGIKYIPVGRGETL